MIHFSDSARKILWARFSIVYAICAAAAFVILALVNTSFAEAGRVAPEDTTVADEPTETIDDIFSRINKEVPTFAGMYRDGDTLYIRVTNHNTGVREASIAAVEKSFGNERVKGQNIVLVDSNYNFNQLRAWYEGFYKAVGTLPGFSSSNIDERDNRLEVGIQYEEQRPSFEEAIRTLDIPADAMTIEVTGPIENISLDDYTRPLVGGLKTTRSGGGDNVCTLGVNGNRSGVLGILTNSHCTPNMGQNDGAIFYQASIGIGVESATSDPPYVAGPWGGGAGCLTGQICRYSDSAFINKYTGAEMSVGRIARPGTTDHSEPIDWNGTDTFRIVGEKLAIMGDPITKVGAKTGRHTGAVLDPCENVTGTDGRTRLCQQSVNYNVEDGDSGSPAFLVTNAPSTNDALLVGINWGKQGSITWISPIGKTGVKRNEDLNGFATADENICPFCGNWDHYEVWRSGSQATNKAVWWSANEYISRYEGVKYIKFNSGGGSSGYADTAYVKLCRALNGSGEPIDCIGEKYVSNITDYGTTTVTYSPSLVVDAGRKYWVSVNSGSGSQKVLLYSSIYGNDYTEGCMKWHDGTLHTSCGDELNAIVEAIGDT